MGRRQAGRLGSIPVLEQPPHGGLGRQVRLGLAKGAGVQALHLDPDLAGGVRLGSGRILFALVQGHHQEPDGVPVEVQREPQFRDHVLVQRTGRLGHGDQLRLQRPKEDPVVPPGGPGGHLGPLQEGDLGSPAGQLQCGRAADDPTAHDDDVGSLRHGA
jgi:hypothetical protein